ncbi:MAG: bifunctional nuclease family protein [Mediterranea sp.]|jgi:bifunctional DNase/RNase|nr:bifunctional nuclease family protein [Mediterranea sp.]
MDKNKNRKIELKIVNIIDTQAKQSAFAMLLQEKNGRRRLPIIVGPAEAQAIAAAINNVRPTRPQTHDLLASILRLCEIEVTEILIYKAVSGVFYSYIYYKKEEELMHVDARPSDAIALAIRMDAPIYINNAILETECILMDTTSKEKGATADRNNLKGKNIRTLKEELDKAIREENYELASVLRDEIAGRQ